LELETVRAEFDGEWVLSPITGKLEEVFPFWQAVKRKFIAVICVIMYVFCALGAIVGVFVLRAALAHTTLELGTILAIAGVVNGLQIQIFNFVYAKISVNLNDYENHRTDSQYENYLIGKSFGFKVINSFATMIYIGFYKRFDWDVRYCKGSFLQRIAKLGAKNQTEANIAESWYFNASNAPLTNVYDSSTQADLYDLYNVYTVHGTDYRGDCFGELAYQLGIIFGMMIVVNNLIEVAGPVVGKFLQNRSQTKDPKAEAAAKAAKNGGDTAALEMAEAKQKEKEIENSTGPYQREVGQDH